MAYTNVTRMLGINSGLDTETLVANMMKAETMRLTQMRKSAMLISLRQDQYRSVYSDLKTFQSSFLNITKAGSIRSSSTFGSKIINVKTSAGQDSGAVTVGSGSKAGTYSINVKQLAVADLYESASKIGGDIKSAKGYVFDVSNIKAGANYELTLDGVSKKISFNEGDNVSSGTITFSGGSIGVKAADGTITQLTEQGFIDVFNEKLKDAFGTEGTGVTQKIEARLTGSGGISISTNGYHSGFSIADGSYMFSSAAGQTAFKDGISEQDRNLGFTVKIGSTSANINVSVTKGMTQQEILDSINHELNARGFGSRVRMVQDSDTGNLKLVNYSATEKIEFGDSTGATGSMQFLGFGKSTVELNPAGSLVDIGITSGSASKFTTTSTLSDVFGSSLTRENSFTINGKTFNFTGNTKLSDLMAEVNKAGLGVTMRYDEYSETFKLESNSTGYVNKISMSGELLTDNLGFGTVAKRAAADSVAVINGTTLTRPTNDYSFEGVDWKLNKTTDDNALTVTISNDTDKAFESIKSFVEGYNALVEKLRDLTNSSRPKYNGSYYDPLTDEEKAEMSDKEIELWEEKANKGLLRNDVILRQITSDLRTALNQSVTLSDGSKISLYSLGIQTSRDTTQGGKLEVDDDKLRKAIEKYGDDIGKLFTNTSGEGGKGLAVRVNDIVNSAISTKGAIARKAGIKGTYTESDNELYRQLTAKNSRIERMLEQLAAKETKYYNMFARMEAAMAKANSQMSYISSLFGGN